MKRAVCIAVFALALGCGQQAMQPLVGASGRIVGQLVSEDDASMDDVSVFLRRDGKIRAKIQSDFDGRFVFEDVAAGAVELVANDGRGMGALVHATVYANGDTDLGQIALGLLRLEPEVLDIFGVGFEERVQMLPPESDLIGFTPSGDPLIVWRRPRKEGSWLGIPRQVARFRLATGSLETLFDDELIGGWRFVGSRTLMVVGDRTPMSAGSPVMAADLETGQTFFRSEPAEIFAEGDVFFAPYSGEETLSFRASAWAAPQGVLLRTLEQEPPQKLVFAAFSGERRVTGQMYASRNDFYSIGRLDDDILLGVALDPVRTDQSGTVAFLLVSPDGSAVQELLRITIDPADRRWLFNPILKLAWRKLYVAQRVGDEAHLLEVDLDRRTAATVFAEPCAADAPCIEDLLVTEDRLFFPLTTSATASIASYDPSTGEVRKLVSVRSQPSPLTGGELVGFGSLRYDAERRAVVGQERATARIITIGADRLVKWLNPELSPGSPEEACLRYQQFTAVSLSVVGADHVRLVCLLPGVALHPGLSRVSGNWVAVDIKEERIMRVIADSVTERPGDVWWPSIRPLDQDREIVFAEDPQLGFNQIWVAPPGAELTEQRRKTHLLVDHEGPLVNPAGDYAYYVIQDPVYNQDALFRVRLTEAD